MRLVIEQQLLGKRSRMIVVEQLPDDLALAEDVPFAFANMPLHHLQLGLTRIHVLTLVRFGLAR
jgi:hypothetical protein